MGSDDFPGSSVLLDQIVMQASVASAVKTSGAMLEEAGFYKRAYGVVGLSS